MTTAEASRGPARAHRRWLMIALVALAGLRTLGDLSLLPVAFVHADHTETKLIVTDWLMSARIVIAPFMACTALYLACRARLPWAIVVLAALNLVEWASDLPHLLTQGLDLSPTLYGLESIAELVLYPLFAVIAIVIALRDRRLALAAVLVGIHSVVFGIEMGTFALAVAIYGF